MLLRVEMLSSSVFAVNFWFVAHLVEIVAVLEELVVGLAEQVLLMLVVLAPFLALERIIAAIAFISKAP